MVGRSSSPRMCSGHLTSERVMAVGEFSTKAVKGVSNDDPSVLVSEEFEFGMMLLSSIESR